MPGSVFFRPAQGWVGDVIPFERDGEFWLYFLHEHRDGRAAGTGWSLVKTTDFVHFDEVGVALPSGGAEAADHNVYTGSVVVTPEAAFLFYTGQNPARLGPDGQTPVQLVMRATSVDDMNTWVRQPELTFGAPRGFEPGDWRDPFVFRPSADGPWRMLITSRFDRGPQRRRGVIAQCVSDDLATWRMVEPFWAPGRYIAHECPDVFRWGKWWYLVYSEFSDRFTTCYRIACSPDGPWRAPDRDTVDGRAFYAAKSVARDGRRFFVGWIASREGDTDDGPWQWAGDMSVLEATQGADGQLAFHIPREIQDSFGSAHQVRFTQNEKRVVASNTGAAVSLHGNGGYVDAIAPVEVGEQFFASVTIDIDSDVTQVGLLVRASADGDQCYSIRLEPKQHRMVFDRWPRQRTGPMQWEVSGDTAHAVELERPCRIDPGVHRIDLLVDDSICIVVLDQQVTLSARMYDRTSGHLGVFATEGSARFCDLSVAVKAAAGSPQ